MPTVLIVDADVDTRAILRMALEANDFTVLEAADGRAALDLVGHCDAVVLNYPVTMGDGSTLTAQLRADQNRDLPILNLTSHALAAEIESAIRDGVSATLIKPHSPSVVISTIRSLLDRR
jgi:CheY-like chemotaxis protein